LTALLPCACVQLSEAQTREAKAQSELEASTAELASCRKEVAQLQQDLTSRTEALEQLLLKHEQAQLRWGLDGAALGSLPGGGSAL
jgi:chromosome segregation ATPase